MTVEKRNNPLRLNVGYMYNKPIGSSREVPLEVDQIEIEDLVIRNLTSLIRMSKTREGLLLQSHIEAEVMTDCGRCLTDFFLPVEASFEDLYQFSSRHREDTDQILPHDGNLDMRPIFREYLVLSLPIKRLCSNDCAGLCVVCGANLNITACDHPDIVQEGQSAVVENEDQI